MGEDSQVLAKGPSTERAAAASAVNRAFQDKHAKHDQNGCLPKKAETLEDRIQDIHSLSKTETS